MSDAEPNDEDAPRWKSPLDAGVDWMTMSKEASAKAAEIERESKIRALVLLDAYAAGDLDAGIGGLRLEAADADAVFRAIAAYQTDLEIQATMPPPARRVVCGWCVLVHGDADPRVVDFSGDQSALTAHVHGCEHNPLVVALKNADASLNAAHAEVERLRALINTPRTDDFFEAVRTEAAHQVERWGVEHDAGKRAEDWASLFVYLLGKAMTAHWAGDRGKLEHHVITVAAVALNWHRNLTGVSTAMRPGIGDDHSGR